MTTEQILEALKSNTESVRRASAIVRLNTMSLEVRGKDTCGVISTLTARPSAAFDNAIAEAQRLLNRQKKLLSLLRKSVS